MNYSDKASSYYANVRYDLINLMESGKKGLKVMEIGAAYGETLFFLKREGIAEEAVGIDIFEDTKNPGNYKPLDRFIFGNMEELDFPEYYEYFDLILLPDVLEHLVEPKNVLKKVHKYLSQDGELLVSMPNIRHYEAFRKIFLKGDFEYEESGLFDYTHMRFYCRKNMVKLLADSAFKVLYQEGSIKNYKGRSVSKIINVVTFGIFEEFFSVQYFLKAKKT